MQKLRLEFGNREHIALVREEEKRQILHEIIGEFPDDLVTREEYDKLKKIFSEALSNIFISLTEINVANEKTDGLQDYVEELISELDSIYP